MSKVPDLWQLHLVHHGRHKLLRLGGLPAAAVLLPPPLLHGDLLIVQGLKSVRGGAEIQESDLTAAQNPLKPRYFKLHR